MPYSAQLTNSENPSSSSYGWNFAKAMTVFVTAVGGYALARASGVFLGWNNEPNMAEDSQNSLAVVDGDFSLAQSNSRLPIQSLDIRLPSTQNFGLTEFTEQEQNKNPLTRSVHKRAVGDEFQVNIYTTDIQH